MISKAPNFAEKYRCSKIDTMVLPARLKAILVGLANGKPQNITLTSESAGTGKTTAAKALARAWGAENHMFINMAHEGKASSIPDIMSYADVEDFSGEEKVVIFDEANSQRSLPFQEPFKAILEKYDTQLYVILTSNGTNNIIDPLLSRCRPIYFDLTGSEVDEVIGGIINRISGVCTKEGISFTESTIKDFVEERFPDMRAMYLDLQLIKNMGAGIEGYKDITAVNPFSRLPNLIVNMDWDNARKVVCENVNSIGRVYRTLYNELLPICNDSRLAMLQCITINKYEHMALTKIDREINAAAMLAELMTNVERYNKR